MAPSCTTTFSLPSPRLFPPSRALSLSRRHSNCELGSKNPIKSKQKPPALPHRFPARPQLSESCLQVGRTPPLLRSKPRIWGEPVGNRGNPPSRLWRLGLFYAGVQGGSVSPSNSSWDASESSFRGTPNSSRLEAVCLTPLGKQQYPGRNLPCANLCLTQTQCLCYVLPLTPLSCPLKRKEGRKGRI